MLDARAIALQGIGFSPLLVAVQGFGDAAATVSWVDQNARAYGKKRAALREREATDAELMRESIRLARQIEDEDEIILAVVMAATNVLGGQRWRH